MSRALLTGLALGLASLAWSAPRAAQTGAGSAAGSATLDPNTARIGERVTYRGRVVLPESHYRVRWLPPDTGAVLTWGPLRARLAAATTAVHRGRGRAPEKMDFRSDTLHVETTVQAFRTGAVTIPGLRFEEQDPDRRIVRALPPVLLIVTPVITAADSNAQLRPPRGPLEAPWWERVPWRIVIVSLLALAAITGVIVWLVRRRKRAVPAAAPPPVIDPAARALAELAALRRRGLPARGDFETHAFELSRILRRFLEATATRSRPGDTTPELLERLAASGLGPEEQRRLGGLLRRWDLVKFARADSNVAEAEAAEAAVVNLVSRWSRPPLVQAA